MNLKQKKDIRVRMGALLKRRREELGYPSIRSFSFKNKIDHSKLTKIEKGLINLRIDTLMEVALVYELHPSELFDFDIPFWEDEMKD